MGRRIGEMKKVEILKFSFLIFNNLQPGELHFYPVHVSICRNKEFWTTHKPNCRGDDVPCNGRI